MLNDLLVELGVEELPSAAVKILSVALGAQVESGLQQANLTYAAVRCSATPRRLAVMIRDVSTQQPAQQISRKGPAVKGTTDESATTAAVIGFAASCGVSVEQLTTTTTDKGTWWMYQALKAGELTINLLPDLITQAVSSLPIAKAMRWGSADQSFVRPLHWVVLLFGPDVVPATILGIAAQRYTYGHRFYHNEPISIPKPDQYEGLLQQAHVIANFEQRRNLIAQQVQDLAIKCQQKAIMPDNLLDEVTSIVEWPQALRANFNPELLNVPDEALIAAMQVHQKCFALRDLNGNLVPAFIAVANIESQKPEQVILGNEQVMHARLSDAAFFYNKDKATPLSHNKQLLAGVIFQEKLGSLRDKTSRIKKLMQFLTIPLQLNPNDAENAADLSKCDLVSGMVGEFPELQGIMGSYYALDEGQAPAVAQAIREHELPRFSSDILPESKLGLALSLADRIDTLVGIFAIGQKPRGVKDPFKLRRHAHAVVRLLIELPTQLSLWELILQAASGYSEHIETDLKILESLKTFILERLPAYYQASGVAAEIVIAARAYQEDLLADMDQRIHALSIFAGSSAGQKLAAISKRVNHLLNKSEINLSKDLNIDPKLFNDPAEQELFLAVSAIQQLNKPKDYTEMFENLSSLCEPTEKFFENVLINASEPLIKNNRLCLLSSVHTLLNNVADLSHLH